MDLKKFLFIIIFSIFQINYVYQQQSKEVLKNLNNNDYFFSESIYIDSPFKGTFSVSVSTSNVSCFGFCDGSITITLTGGNPIYPIEIRIIYPPDQGGGTYFFYIYDPSEWPFVLQNLCASEAPYQIRVKDNDGHQVYTSATILSPGQMFIDDYSISDETCYGLCDGSIEIYYVFNAQYPLYYQWSSGEIGSSSGEQFGIYNKCNGTYFLTVTDSRNCTKEFDFTILSPDPLIIENINFTEIICVEGTGQISVDVSGGNPPYSFNIGYGNQSSNTFSNLNSGTYTVTITDNSNCSITTPPLTIQLSIFNLQETHTNPTCYGNNNGSIDLTVNGGIPPFNYLWQGPEGFSSTSEDIYNLIAGTYYVTVTDAGNCTNTLSVELTQPNEIQITSTYSNVSCYGGSNGSITLNVIGGTSPYTYQWTGPSCPCPNSNSISNLSAGIYNVTVSDINNCTGTLTIQITQPQPINVSFNKQNVTCYGLCDGSIDITVNGGTPSYSYLWVGPNGFSSNNEDISNLCSGTYYLTITDANNCTYENSYAILSPSEINISFTNITEPLCAGQCNGSISISVNGGTPDYTYIWNGPSCPCTGTNITNLCSGTYTITVIDAAGCTKDASTTINEPSPILLSETHIDVACVGQNTGSIDLTVSGNYTPPLSYSWTGPNGYANNTEDIYNLFAGTYSVTVTDANSCTASLIVNINEVPEITINALISDITCYGYNNGYIDITITGGTVPFTYNWVGPPPFSSNSEDIYNLIAGTYFLTVSDVNNCIKDTFFIIHEPPEIITSINLISNITCNGMCNGSATVIINGGVPPYSYIWSNGENNDTITNGCAGWNYVSVYDTYGCFSKDSIYFDQPQPINISFTNVNMSCYTPIFQEILGDGIYIPDGMQCPDPCFEATIEINVFPPDKVITSITDIQSICINMEHSFSGDLSFKIICPNGQDVILDSYDNSGSAYLGLPDEFDCTSCSTQPIVCPKGTGWDYCWSEIFPQQGYLNILDGGISPIPPVDYNNNTGYFTPEESLSGLIGCPLNGTWTLRICDEWLIDDGWLFWWKINFDPTLFNQEECNGSATVIPENGTLPYSFVWSNGQTSQTVSNLCGGTYFVTVSDANNCTNTSLITIHAVNINIDSITKINASCGGICNGSATVFYSGGIDPINIIWSNGETSQTITNVCAGKYYVTVSSYNCYDIDSVEILNNYDIDLTYTITEQIYCYGECTGSAIVNAYGGQPPYTFIPNQTINNACAGTYTVTVTDANGCYNTTSITFTQPQELIIENIQVQNSGPCAGSNNGTITIFVNGGTPPYLYSIGQQFQTNNVFTNLSPGTYTVTIKDNNGCTITSDPITIIEPPPLIIDSLKIENEFPCNYSNNGSITVYVSGGTPQYYYNIGLGQQSSNSFTNLNAGIYQVTITDINGCTITTNPINITEPEPITINLIQKTEVLCGHGDCSGILEIQANGGTPSYTYVWNPDFGNTNYLSNLCAGIYFVTVYDQYNCTSTSYFEITDTSNLTLNISTIINPLCYNDCNGQITVSVANGTSPYTFIWSTGDTTWHTTETLNSQENLCAGNYYVTVVDFNVCSRILYINLTQPEQLTAEISILSPILCYGECTGAISVLPNGGTPNYSFIWNDPNNSTTQTISNICAGDYQVTITDQNGCSVTSSIVLTQPLPLNVSINILNQISCFGSCDGTLSANVSGGTPTYSYYWNNNVNSPVNNNLCSDTYYLTITDANNCSKVDSVFLPQPIPISIDFTNITETYCGICSGSVTAIASGGTPEYTYLWSNGQNTSSIDSLCADLYIITVTDNNGCTATSNIIISDTSSLTINILQKENISCYGWCDGIIFIEANGGHPPYSYIWNTGATGNYLTNLCSGTYYVTVSDIFNCVEIKEITIDESSILQATPIVTQISCAGNCDGQISLQVNGGNPPYIISWSPSIDDPFNLCPGTYNYTITDEAGCSINGSATILELPPININFTILSDIKCYGENTAEIMVHVSNINDYTLLWNTGDTSHILSNLSAGTYSVTVYGQNNCQDSASIYITQPSQLNLTFTDITPTYCGYCLGSATAIVFGGTPNYYYLWDENANFQQTPTADSLCVNVYSITVLDNNGCSIIGNISIIDTSDLTLNIIDIQNVTCGGWCNGSIIVSAEGGFPPYNYLWNNGDTTNNLTNLCAGEYRVTVTDSKQCMRIEIINIDESATLTANENVILPSCSGLCDAKIILTPIGGNPPYVSFQWSDQSISGPIAENLCPNTYYYTITDNAGCSYTDSVQINDQLPFSVQINPISQISCYGLSNGVLQVSVVGALNYSIHWNNGDTTQIISNLSAGIYSVTVIGNGNCIDSATYVLNQPDSLLLSFSNVIQPNCYDNCNGQITANVIGGTPPYSYLWSNNETSQTISSLCADIYFITITDNNNCTVSDYVILPDQTNIEINLINLENVSCYDSCDGLIEITAEGGNEPYTFTWLTEPPINGNVISNLCPGLYIVKVTDNNLCSNFGEYEITQPNKLEVNTISKDVSCYGYNDGSIILLISGGTLPYSIFVNSEQYFNDTLINLTNGIYIINISDANNCFIIDTIEITQPEKITVYKNIKNPLCNKYDNSGYIELEISGGTPEYTILWNNNQQSFSIYNLNPGLYSFTITDNNNCLYIDTIQITSLINVNAKAIGDTIICLNDSAQIFGIGGKTFYWTPGNTLSDSTIFNPFAKPQITTTYYYYAFDSICYDIDSVTISIYPPLHIDAGLDKSIFFDQTTILNGTITGIPYYYYWTPSNGLSDTLILNPTAKPFETITYYLIAISYEGCKFIDSVKITVLPKLKIPTAITPNNDGINDVWIIDMIDKFPNCEIMIFNRWGEQLFYSKGYPENERWDGTYKGKPLPVGTYYYVILLNDEAFPEPITGPIVIKR